VLAQKRSCATSSFAPFWFVAQPNNDLASVFVYLFHVEHLEALLLIIRLVDAYRNDPADLVTQVEIMADSWLA